MGPNVVPSSALMLALVDLLAGQLDAATVSLFINDVDPGKNAVIADFTLAAFVGSTPIAVSAWGEAYLNANKDAEAQAQLMQWNYASGPEESVYGIVVKGAGAGTPLLLYCRLDNPKGMGTTSDSLALVLRFTLSDQG